MLFDKSLPDNNENKLTLWREFVFIRTIVKLIAVIGMGRAKIRLGGSRADVAKGVKG